MSAPEQTRVLAIASGGGHWVQLLRLRSAFAGAEVTFASVRPSYAEDVPGENYVTVPDATRWERLQLLAMMIRVTLLVIRLRPHVILSTGAAPGYVAIRVGKLIGARTAWVDSIANVERVSMSGQRIGPHVDLWLTQWKHLESVDGPRWEGSVL